MGLLDSILSAAQKPSGAGEANPLLGVLSGLLTQSGGRQGLASKFSQSGQGQFLAEYLPKIVDKLTPTGKVDPTADHQQGLAALLPSLLQSLSGEPSGGQSAQA